MTQLPKDLTIWFGASRVLDPRGRPLVVYHWTDMGDFDRFEHTNDIGFHFGTRPAAERRREQVSANSAVSGRERMVAALLKIANPLRLADQGDWCPKNVVNALVLAGILDDDAADEAYDAIIDREWAQATLARAGYDGIIYDNETEGGGDCWIVFDPDQIRILERQPMGAAQACPCGDPACPGPTPNREPPIIPAKHHHDLGDAWERLYGG